jgi:hypothetical protein
MKWLQDLGQSNVDNLNNARRVRNRSKERLKAKTEELETNSKIKY